MSKAAAPPPPAAEPPVAISPPTETLVVLDAGEAPAPTKKDIVETAKAERARRQTAEPPVAVITDKNLGQFAAGQKLTVATPGAPAAAAAPAASAAGPASEDYWRQRGRDLRTHWREAVDRIAELQKQATELRARFYSTDDPYVRDTQVKPAWDRTLEQIREAQRVADESRQKVDDYLEEGRHAGALPGWLREGIELEPTPASPPAPTAEPSEPVVIQEPPPQ